MIRTRAVVLALAIAPLGCAPQLLRPARPAASVEPLHLSSVAGSGDAARRASTRIALEGIDADAAGRSELAADRYARALQVDATNPWVYLALARHRLDEGRPADALAALDQAEARLRAEHALSPGAQVDIAGLRGEALVASGDASQGRSLLRDAAEREPSVWADGHLDAAELR